MRQVHRQIQWFPGHMNRTRRLIEEQVSRIDIVIEILDARIPQSSRNPLLEEIISGLPVLMLLNKSDLADPVLTKTWMQKFETEGFYTASVSANEPKTVSDIIPKCRQIVETVSGKKNSKINVLVAGIPNVGKSTIINSLKKQKKASVQNKPGHTKDFQRIVFSNMLTLIDTPGILWHKFETAAGYKLAVMGSIKDSILDMYTIANAALLMLKKAWPSQLVSRYKLEPEEVNAEPGDLIDIIGRKRGMLQRGGVVDFERACSIIIREIREGKLDRMTFESPENTDERFPPDLFDSL